MTIASLAPVRPESSSSARSGGIQALDQIGQGLAIAGERRHVAGVAGEGHQRQAVVAQDVEQIAHLALGALQAIGLEVARQHRTRGVDADHQVDPAGQGAAFEEAPHRPAGGDAGRHDREGREHPSQATASGIPGLTEFAGRSFIEGARQGAPALTARARLEPQHGQRRHRDQGPLGAQPLDVGGQQRSVEQRHHGRVLRSQVVDSSWASR
jgi:hypothetical protein